MKAPVSPVPTCSMQPRGMQSFQLQPKFCSEVEPAVCRSHPAPQPSVPRAFPEHFPAPAGSLRHVGMILQALGMLSLPACPSPELLDWLALHPGLAKPSLSTSAGNWASPVGSSCIPEGEVQERTDSEPSLCNTPNPLLPLPDEGLQFCARGYGWELMEMMGTSLRNPSFQHQPDPTSHPTQQDRQEGERQRVHSFSSPFSLKSGGTEQAGPALTWLLLFSCQLEGDTTFHGSELLSNAPVSSSRLLRCANPSNSPWTSFPFRVSPFSNYRAIQMLLTAISTCLIYSTVSEEIS